MDQCCGVMVGMYPSRNVPFSKQQFLHSVGGPGAYAGFSEGGCREGGGVPRSAKEANNPILLKVQSLQLSFRPAGVSLGGGGGGAKAPPGPPCVRPWGLRLTH